MATVQEVQEIYKDLLGREAAQGGLDYWTQGNQGSLEDIRANIAAGGEAKEYASRKTAVEQIYDDFGLTKDEAGVEHWIDSGDDFQKIQDDIGTHFQAGGSRHDEAKTKLQDIYDDHYGKKQDGTSNQVVGSAGLDYWLGEGGLTEDASGHGGMGSWDTVKKNIELHTNPYASLDLDDDGINDPIDGDPNGDGIIDDDEVTGIKDDTLDGFNTGTGVMEPNQTSGKYTTSGGALDLLSNGFKIRTDNAFVNSSSYDPYVYMAWGDVPFKYNNTF